MDYIWTPWRYRYVTRGVKGEDCPLCQAASRADDDEQNLVLFRAEANFIILNLFPYTTGHLMVVPYRHLATLSEAPEPVALEMMALTRRAEGILREVYRPEGLNVGMNIGACAGAGISGHIHMHVLPRWPGDASFMATVGETRVLPEDLQSTYAKLKPAFASAAC